MKSSKLLTALLSVTIAAVLLAGSVAVPILCRPFYYAHIHSLDLPGQTGYTEAEIRAAFDEMMDYCTGGDPFSAGGMAWSEEGKSHFADVRRLFLFDLNALWVSAAALVVLLLVCRLGGRRPARLAGRGPCFWAGAGLGCAFLLIGGLAALDFDRAFVVFHALFFPGKDNWLFDPRTDEIINVLPQEFFMHCALLILGILIVGCVVLMAADLLKDRRRG